MLCTFGVWSLCSMKSVVALLCCTAGGTRELWHYVCDTFMCSYTGCKGCSVSLALCTSPIISTKNAVCLCTSPIISTKNALCLCTSPVVFTKGAVCLCASPVIFTKGAVRLHFSNHQYRWYSVSLLFCNPFCILMLVH